MFEIYRNCPYVDMYQKQSLRPYIGMANLYSMTHRIHSFSLFVRQAMYLRSRLMPDEHIYSHDQEMFDKIVLYHYLEYNPEKFYLF